MAPEEFTVKTEEYPLARQLFLYTPVARPRQLAGELLEYALSPDVQKIAADTGFINLGIGLSSESYAGDRIAGALASDIRAVDPVAQSTAPIRSPHKAHIFLYYH
jgi:phosphate transport system substrate-binding protein